MSHGLHILDRIICLLFGHYALMGECLCCGAMRRLFSRRCMSYTCRATRDRWAVVFAAEDVLRAADRRETGR